MVELALVVAPLDQLVEGDVGLVDTRVLGCSKRDLAGEEDGRIEEHELRDELRSASRELEREPAAERVPDERRRTRADRLDDRVEMSFDVPRRLVRGRAMPEEVRSEDVESGELLRKPREVPAVVPHTVEADDPGSARRRPTREARAVTRLQAKAPSDSVTAS